ncbi:hypothetical protein J1N35_003872 [Gossypium stocksii]|uniref:Reverse transcriptase domain-containing protein n=1 Tax=Gossypium stocksii TaxID=47602 RepID=A0A9D3WBQ4_9ROSI|nr:hypothetical protein J1N35_003872 [Gossypium stocksii]
MEELRILNLEFGETMRFKESIWKQKSRMSWLKEGDSNSAFFHRAVKFKAKRKMVNRMKFGNYWYSNPMALKEKLVNYFSDHFSCLLRNWKMDFVLNFKRLSDSEASNLELPFSMEEIKEAVWSCDENKAPGPDGFNICFFRKCWGVVKNDLYEMLKEFYLSRKLERCISSSFISLIPKNENPSKISKFRPIYLVSSLYKIVAKVLSRRLSGVVGGVVSDTQCAFIRGRQNFYGILIANEIIHSIKKKAVEGGSLILKLDFAKAYDCVRWDFLELVLLKMGFGVRWTGWMLECVSTARAAVLINGAVTNEFKFSRGLRQGDPLSPFLFILVTEALHLMLVKVKEIGMIEGIKSIIPRESISHLQFADDTILFLRADENVVRNSKYILCCFEMFSGLSINFSKSCIVGFDLEEEFLYRLAAVYRCRIGELPINYLGLPLGVDPRRSTSWNGIIDRVERRLSGWKCQSLSWVGRVVLINSVLSSMPIYFLSIFQAHSAVVKKIDKIRRNFLWGNVGGCRKMAKIRWK